MYEIPEEYEGDDYVRDCMDIVRAILEEDNNISQSPRESETPREEPSFMKTTPLVFLPFVLLSYPSLHLNIPIDFYANLFCDETI